MSTIISNNINIARRDESESLIDPATVQLSYNVYNTINVPSTGIDRIVTASLTDTVPPYQANTKGQGSLGLVVTQAPISGTDVTNFTLAEYTTQKFGMSSTPEACNSNGAIYSSASGRINDFGNNGAVAGAFGSLLDLDAFTVSSGNNINRAHMTMQCMANGVNPFTSIEFDGDTDNDSIMQLKLRSTYDAFNTRRNARSTLKLPLQYGTAPNTLVTGNYGTSGQVLTSGGQNGNLTWATPSSDPNTVPLSSPPDSATLAVNNSVKIQNGETGSETNYIELSSDSNNNTISLSGTFGTSGQVLTSGGSAGSLSWTTPASSPNINTVLQTGDTATDKQIFMRDTANLNQMYLDEVHLECNTATSVGGTLPYVKLYDTNVSTSVVVNETTLKPTFLEFTSRAGTTNTTQYTSKTININSDTGDNGDILTSNGVGGMTWASQVGVSSRALELVGSTIKTNNKTLINTNGSATEYAPNNAYGDALIVYNNVGYVSGVSDGFGECIFQNKSATANSSNIIALCESNGDYMSIGQNSSVTTALNNTLFEIRGAGYSSSTGHQIIGANSSGSATKSVILSYANGAAGLQINPSGALGIGAVPTVVGTEVQLTNGSFGSAGQVLSSNGSAGALSWITPTAPDPNVVPLTTPIDSTTLTANNSVRIQNGETGAATNYIEVSSDSGYNTISLTGTFGTAGQVLSSGGSSGSLSWITPTAPDPNVVPLATPPNALTLAVNNSIKIQNGETGSVINYIHLHADNSNRNRLDLSGDFGTTGQVLTSGSSTGSLGWTTLGLNAVLGADSLATNKTIEMNNTGNTNQTIIDCNSIELNTATGSGGTMPYIELFDQDVVTIPNYKPYDTILRPDYLQFESMTSTGVNVNNTKYGAKTISINSFTGITGLVLGSNGSNTMGWKGTQIHNVQSTSGNVTSTVDPSINTDCVVFISTDAGPATGRVYFLPVTPPIGFMVTVKNCSGVAWSIATSETNGLIFGSNTGTSNGVNIGGTGGKVFFQYAGTITVNSVTRPVWIG